MEMPADKRNVSNKFILLFTGHLLDAANRKDSRFTHHMLEDARSLISIYIDKVLLTKNISCAVCSLAAGGDMLFADEILKRKIPLTVFIPFEKEHFITTSVNYLKGMPDENPEEWRNEFERLLLQVTDLKYLDHTETTGQAYSDCNKEILEYALTQREENVLALALMRHDEEAAAGGTAHFVKEIKKQNITVDIVWVDDEGQL